MVERNRTDTGPDDAIHPNFALVGKLARNRIIEANMQCSHAHPLRRREAAKIGYRIACFDPFQMLYARLEAQRLTQR